MNRLRLGVHLGVGDGERSKPQPIELDIRFYFPQWPACMVQDESERYVCYDELTQAITSYLDGKSFRLIEYLTHEIFSLARAHVIAKLADEARDVRIWVRLTKCAAPVPALIGGASFVCTDLPGGVGNMS